MSLSNDPNPSDESLSRGEDRQSQENLSFPPAPRAFYNRMLVDAYLRNCKRRFAERVVLITSRSQMDYEDRVILGRMESTYRAVFNRKLQQFGLSDKGSEVTVRVLHPVVAVGKTHREYHLYLDIVAENGRCWFLDFDAAASFERGPAAIQLSSVGPQGKTEEIVATRLFSVPAFREALEKLANASLAEVFSNPHSFVAFDWIVQAIAKVRNGRQSRDSLKGFSAPPPLPLSSIQNFTWTGQTKPFAFECSVENAYYVAHMQYHDRTRQPFVILHEEVF